MTSKRNADVNIKVNLNVNLYIVWTLIANVIYARTDVPSQQKPVCPDAALGRWSIKTANDDTVS